MKIYTRTGDEGTSGLYSGERLSKADIRFEALGAVDELNAAIGVARAGELHPDIDAMLRRTQELLFELGADLATTGDTSTRIGADDVAWLEEQIDRMTAILPELRAFILPSGHPAAAAIHAARAICRRAERIAVDVATCNASTALPFLNRLSDFLFTAARFQNHLAGVIEESWTPRT